jgi:iron complex outermembrane receptor protein
MRIQKERRCLATSHPGRLAVALVALAAADVGRAAAAPEGPITRLAPFTVTDVPLEEQILPTALPVTGVLGDSRSILETPRSVSFVNAAWMEHRGVRDAMDFGQFAAGVYSPAQYGIPATPQIRGDLGELYLNGQQMKFSRNSVFPSFNGIEALEIVRGPGSAVYGPQGQGPGGYVNLVSKRPYFDRHRTQLRLTLGYFVPDGQSHFNPEFQIDAGGPMGEGLAYRFSYLGRDGDGYYRYQKNETQDAYLAISWLGRNGFTLEWLGQFYASRFNEVAGVNRVTQAYIDDQLYAAGAVQPLNAFGSPVGSSPSFVRLDPATYRLVKLEPYQTLSTPRSSARAKRLVTQLIATKTAGPDARVRNLTYFETRTSRKFEAYGYDEYVPRDWALSNRFEYHRRFASDGPIRGFIAGADVEFQRLISYQDFSSEPFFLYDLTQPAETILFPPYPTTGTFGGLPIPGKPGYSGNPFPDSGNQDSEILDTALFAQADLNLMPQLTGVIGLRLDHIDARARSSNLVGRPTGSFYDVEDDILNPGYFVSLQHTIASNVSAYATYNRVHATTGTIIFGGINGASNSREGLRNSMRGLSELLEVGIKASLFRESLFVSAALFEQTRQRPQLNAPAAEVQSSGVEVEAVFQPSTRVSLSANLTYQEATLFGRSFYQQTGNYRDGYPSTLVIDGQPGTGRGSPNFTRYLPPGGRMRATSVPSFLANAYLTIESESGFALGIGPQFTGRQYQNDEGTLIIPFQYQVDGFLAYRRAGWDVQLNVRNLTDERNYTPIDPTFAGNDVIYPNPPLSASLTLRTRF